MRAYLRMLVSLLVSAVTLSCTIENPAGPVEPVASVAIAPQAITLPVGGIAQFAVTLKSATGANLESRAVSWSSSNTSVVTVSPTGGATALGQGTATLTAASEGKSGIAAITVGVQAVPPGPTSLVENMDAVDASTLRAGLGFNIDGSQLWQFAAAKAAGATEVRMQFDWPSVERTPGALALTPAQAAALDECARLGLQPQLVAAYGPGWVDLGTFTLTAGAAIGSTTLTFVQDISAVEPYFGHVVRTNGTFFISSQYASYAGAMIKAVNPATKTITLAAPTVNTLTSGTNLILRRRHYRAPGTVTGGTDTNGGIAHYTDYVRFLANQISSRGLTGRVEIWNEPPWLGDRWDGGEACFIADANWGGACPQRAYGFARALVNIDPPTGVRWTWGGTNLTGFASIHGDEIGLAPTQAQVKGRVAAESFHPYGATPEWHAYDPEKLRAASIYSDIYTITSLVGVDARSNFKYARKLAMNNQEASGWAVAQTMTEHGYNSTNRVAQARFLARTYLTYLSLGFERINFYRLATRTADPYNYEIVDGATHAPFQAYNSLQSLMADLDALGTSPTTGTAALPQVATYFGHWPLMVIPIRGGGAAGSVPVLLALWQRTYPLAGERFDQIVTPAPGTVEIEVPTGLRVVGAWSLTDRAPVSVRLPTITRAVLEVRDDPVVVRLEPR